VMQSPNRVPALRSWRRHSVFSACFVVLYVRYTLVTGKLSDRTTPMMHVGHHWPNALSSNSRQLLQGLHNGEGRSRLPSARAIVAYVLLMMLFGPFFLSISIVIGYRLAF